MNKPAPMTDEQIGDLIPDTADEEFEANPAKFIRDFTRAIEAAVNAKWEAMLAGQEPIGILRSDPYEGHIFEPTGERWPFNAPLYAAPVAAQPAQQRDVIIKGDLYRITFLPDDRAEVVVVQANAAQPAQEPSKGCPNCGNEYLAIRTDIYKDKREFFYCDCCGAMADRKTWEKATAQPAQEPHLKTSFQLEWTEERRKAAAKVVAESFKQFREEDNLLRQALEALELASDNTGYQSQSDRETNYALNAAIAAIREVLP
jgi:hypothetical protein